MNNEEMDLNTEPDGDTLLLYELYSDENCREPEPTIFDGDCYE